MTSDSPQLHVFRSSLPTQVRPSLLLFLIHQLVGLVVPSLYASDLSGQAGGNSLPTTLFLHCRSTRMWNSSVAVCGMTSRSTSSGRRACYRITQSSRRRTSACRSRCQCSGRTRCVGALLSRLGSGGLRYLEAWLAPHLYLCCWLTVGLTNASNYQKWKNSSSDRKPEVLSPLGTDKGTPFPHSE